MKHKRIIKHLKTFPLQIEENLHKALKHKAIESNLTLHTYIIETLSSCVQEEPPRYAVSGDHSARHSEAKK